MKKKILKEVDIDVSFELSKEREEYIDNLMEEHSKERGITITMNGQPIEEETLESKVRNLFNPIKNYIASSRMVLSNMEDSELVEIAQREGLKADQNIYAIISEIHNTHKVDKLNTESIKQFAIDSYGKNDLSAIEWNVLDDFIRWLKHY
jgi:hypothetical protein